MQGQIDRYDEEEGGVYGILWIGDKKGEHQV